MAQLGLGEELRALALISLGIAELWSLRLDEAEAHLERGVALARRIGRPLLEINGLAHWGVVASFRSSALAAERGLQAIELARRHGRSGEPLVAIAYPMVAGSFIWRGELEEAERWLVEGEQALHSEVEPVTGMLFHLVRGFLEIARGRAEAALRARRAPARTRPLIAAHPLVTEARASLLHVLARLGETAQADPALIREAISMLGGGTLVAPRTVIRGADGASPALTGAPARAAQPGRGPRPALPADQPFRAGDRPASFMCR